MSLSPRTEQTPDQILLEPFVYISGLKGKEIRPKLIKAFQTWLQVPQNILEAVEKITQMLHNASLMIDDIEDNSQLRRGVPVAHAIYGIPHVINSANYVYFDAISEVIGLGRPEATAGVIEEMMQLHRGQGLDIYWRDHLVVPTEEEYSNMVINKTGGLFRLAVRIMQCFSSYKEDLIPLVNLLGLYFQILDDYLNIVSSKYEKNKGFMEDLTEGKFSFPILHSIRACPSDNRLLNIVKQKTDNKDLKLYALNIMEETESLPYCVTKLDALRKEIISHIDTLGGNPALVAIVELLHSAIPEDL